MRQTFYGNLVFTMLTGGAKSAVWSLNVSETNFLPVLNISLHVIYAPRKGNLIFAVSQSSR